MVRFGANGDLEQDRDRDCVDDFPAMEWNQRRVVLRSESLYWDGLRSECREYGYGDDFECGECGVHTAGDLFGGSIGEEVFVVLGSAADGPFHGELSSEVRSLASRLDL